MYRPAQSAPSAPVFLSPWSWDSVGPKLRAQYATAPASGAWPAANRTFFVPVTLHQPYDCQRVWWLNGATVGTDRLTAMVYSDAAELVCSGAPTLSAGANAVQYAAVSVTSSVVSGAVTAASANTAATPSLTLRARPGYVYVLTVANSFLAGSANTVTAQTTGGAVTFTSRQTLAFDANRRRVTVLTAVPTADVTDTVTVTVASAQTADEILVNLELLANVDATTNHGFVQTATGTGNSTTPLATLGAFSSTANATFAAHADATSDSATAGAGFFRVTSNPGTSLGLATMYTPANDTTADGTVSVTQQWGSIAAEVKSLGTTRILGPGRYYMALGCTGTTATVFRVSSAPAVSNLGVYQASVNTDAPPGTVTLAASTNSVLPVFGITSRATP